MQKGVLLEADVHERGFQAGLKVFDLSLEHAGDDARFGGALDGELFELAFFENGDAVLQRLGVDDDFLEDAFLAAPGEQFLALFEYLFDRVHNINRPSCESTRFVTAREPSCWPARTIPRN